MSERDLNSDRALVHNSYHASAFHVNIFPSSGNPLSIANRYGLGHKKDIDKFPSQGYKWRRLCDRALAHNGG